MGVIAPLPRRRKPCWYSGLCPGNPNITIKIYVLGIESLRIPGGSLKGIFHELLDGGRVYSNQRRLGEGGDVATVAAVADAEKASGQPKGGSVTNYW